MRSALLPILALLAATPSIASASEGARGMDRMAIELKRPATQDAMAGAIGALLGAFMDMRVDGIAKALEPMNGGKPIRMKGNTVREIAQARDPNIEAKVENGSRALVSGAGAVAQAMAVMLPQLEEAMAKAGDAIDRAKDQMPDAR
jgi:hypothetical protein